MSHGSTIGQQADDPSISALQGAAKSQNRSLIGSSHMAPSNPGPSSSFSGTAESTNSTSEDEQIQLLKELKSSVHSFCGGKVTKTDVIANVLQILKEEVYLSNSIPKEDGI